MNQQKTTTSRRKRTRTKNRKRTLLASARVDVGTFNPLDPRKDTYVLGEDLFVEPTPKQLRFTTNDYVPFLTDSNNLLDALYSILNTSPTNSAIVQQKTVITTGEGFTIKEGKRSILTQLKGVLSRAVGVVDPAKESLSEFLHEVNPEMETMQDVLHKAANEFWAYGNCFVELIRAEVDGDKALYVRNVPVYMCRPKKAGKDRVVKYIGVSDGWIEGENTPETVIDYPLYPNFERVGQMQSERSIIHIKNYKSQFYYWGVPDYISCTLWGEMEYRIPKFNQAKFDNGFTPSALVTLKGSYSQQEASMLVDKFQETFTQTGNNSKILMQVVNDEDAKMDAQILEQNLEGQFMQLSNMSRQQIVTGHRWTMSLAGMGVSGQLGSNQQIVAEFAILNSTVINPVQRMLEAKLINPIVQQAGQWQTENWENLSVCISSKTPISFLGDIKVGDVLTRDEQREILGYQGLENEDNGNTDTN